MTSDIEKNIGRSTPERIPSGMSPGDPYLAQPDASGRRGASVNCREQINLLELVLHCIAVHSRHNPKM